MDIIKKFFEYSKILYKVCLNKLIMFSLIKEKIINFLVLCHLIVIFLLFLVSGLVFIFFIICVMYYVLNVLFGNYIYCIEYTYIHYKLFLLKLILFLILGIKLILDLGSYFANLNNLQNFINFKKEKNVIFNYDIELILFIIIISSIFFINEFLLGIFMILLMLLYKHYNKSIYRIIDDYIYDDKIKVIVKCLVRITFFLLILILINQVIS